MIIDHKRIVGVNLTWILRCPTTQDAIQYRLHKEGIYYNTVIMGRLKNVEN